MNINPVGMPVRTWCDFMVSELLAYGQVPYLQTESDWQDWGQRVCKLPGIAGLNPPNPMYFNNFYDWAERFNSAVPL